MASFSLVFLLFAALGSCLGPKKPRFDVFGLVQTTKTLTLELSNEVGERTVVQGNVTEISKDARRITGMLWQDLSALDANAEGAESNGVVVERTQPLFAPRLWRFESTNATSYAVYTAPVPESPADAGQGEANGAAQAAEPVIVWTKLIDTKLGEKWSVPMEYFDQSGRKLIVRILNSVSVDVTIIPPAAEPAADANGTVVEPVTSTLRIVRTTNVKKQSMLQSMMMPLLTMLPMQIMQMRQRKKMAAEQAQAAQQGGAATAAGASPEQAPQEGGRGARAGAAGRGSAVAATHAPEREREGEDAAAADTAVAAGVTEGSSSADELVE